MENASKALLMAATVLLGVMIISVGVVLFNSFSDFARDTTGKVEETRIAEWNQQYLKYYGQMTWEKEGKIKSAPIQVTAHEIMTVVNQARQNNVNYFGDDIRQWPGKNENYYYVQVEIKGARNGNRAETWGEETKNNFLKENSLTDDQTEPKYYRCSQYEISSVTKRVMYIQFIEYDK